MAQLTSRLVISLIDRVSGPARGIAASMRALNASAAMTPARALRQEGRRFAANAQRFASSYATPFGLGAAAIVGATNEFEKAFLGVQIAGIADNIEGGVVQMQKLGAEAAKAREQVLGIADDMKFSPTELMQAWEAVGKMGLPEKNRKTLVEMAGSVAIQDSEVSAQTAAEFLGGLGIQFKAGETDFDRGTGKGDYNADVTRLANQLLAISNMTRTSVGRMQDGLRQFAPLYAALGVTFSETSALLGGMVQAGLDEVSSGTALKSFGVRMLKPTAEGREAMYLAGIDRRKYMSLDPVSANRTAVNIRRLSAGAFAGKGGAAKYKELQDFLFDAQKSGRMRGPNWQQELTEFYNNLTGAKDAPTKDRNADMLEMAGFTAGGKIDMFSLFKDLAKMQGTLSDGDAEKVVEGLGLGDLADEAMTAVEEKLVKGELTAAQLATIGEGRHLNRYTALLAMMPEVIRYQEELNKLTNQYSEAGNDLYKQSPFGQRMAAWYSLQTGLIKIGESEGFTRFIAGIGQMTHYLANLSPETIENIGYAIVGLGAVGAVGIALGGVAAAFGLLASSARLAFTAVRALFAVLGGGAALRGLMGLLGVGGAAAAGTGVGAGAAGLAGLFAGGGAVASTKLGRKVAQGMGKAGAQAANKAIGDAMIKGMTGGAAASVGANAMAKGGLLGPLVKGLGKGLARIFPFAAAGLAGMDAYTGYRMDGWKGFFLNPLTLGMYSGGDAEATEAAPPPAGEPPAAAPSPSAPPKDEGWSDYLAGLGSRFWNHFSGNSAPTEGEGSGTPAASAPATPQAPDTSSGQADLQSIASAAQAITATVQSAMAQIRGAVAAVDLTAEGQRIAQSLANGIRAGIPAIQAASSAAAAAAANSAARGAFSDGGR